MASLNNARVMKVTEIDAEIACSIRNTFIEEL